ncbi:hypothetical protein JKF63_06588 [Porcisia hertigi]|uniref:PhoD-like phosphatase metallophosphatase domain-containing protein n=1 Tax=Porcisia hertigi TaxID=2761500 RepID=A0A836IDX6_9TRYP|nr:hypothetical protein JKF63_06588 [Porcisia hertigi]
MRRRVFDGESHAKQGILPALALVSRRHRSTLIALVLVSAGLLMLANIVLIFSWLTEDNVATPTVDYFKTSDAWLNRNENQEEWRRAQIQAEHLNLPSPHGISTSQVFFISCNRHDRSQLYWAYMATAAQCEMLSRANATAAPSCRKLYSGESPLIYTDDAAVSRVPPGPLPKSPADADGKVRSNEVPLGACGSVYDNAEAALYRPRHWRTPPPGLLVDETLPPSHRAAGPQRGLRVAPHDTTSLARVPVDALIWLGDAIYADKLADGYDSQSLFFQHANTMVTVGQFWRIQRDAPEYNAFINSCVAGSERLDWNRFQSTEIHLDTSAHNRERTPHRFPSPSSSPHRNVWGTWDDHDMGKNDAGREYAQRNSTQRFFLEFLRAPPSDPRWHREGVYQAYTIAFREAVNDANGWGAPLQLLLERVYEHAICVVLLDVRSFRDRPDASHTGDMLGAAQWEWFEALIQNYTTPTRDGQERCAMVLIGGGIQFMLDEKPAENWAAFPHSRDRLLGLLRAYGLERATFITGDVHMGELGADFTEHAIGDVLGYPMVEATSSGLTHSANMYFLPSLMLLLFPSSRRLSLYVDKNFGSLRLSLDLRHLPSIRSYLNDAEAAISKGPKAEQAKERLKSPEWRREARAAVEQALNATFTIFSIPNSGQPVHRLNFPLAMLTYAHGAAYRDATVNAVDGSVYRRSTAPPVTWEEKGDMEAAKATARTTPSSPRSLLLLKNGTITYISHYRNTEPAPFITWSARQLQYYLFTGFSVPETLKLMVLFNMLFCVWVLLLVFKKIRRHRWPQRRASFSPCRTV